MKRAKCNVFSAHVALRSIRTANAHTTSATSLLFFSLISKFFFSVYGSLSGSVAASLAAPSSNKFHYAELNGSLCLCQCSAAVRIGDYAPPAKSELCVTCDCRTAAAHATERNIDQIDASMPSVPSDEKHLLALVVDLRAHLLIVRSFVCSIVGWSVCYLCREREK